MPAFLLSIGKTIPPYSLSQIDIAAYLIENLGLDDEDAWKLEKIYKNSTIERRYSVLPHLLLPTKDKPIIGMSERNAHYKREAPILAHHAAKNAIDQWQGNVSEITHVLSVSCTGAITPGLELKLLQSLGLSPATFRLGINFMGCYGAFKGISVAHKIACENPKHRVLVVCTELCTLHFRPGDSLESMVIHSLFADGASAVIIGGEPRSHEQPIFEIINEQSHLLDDSAQDMTWDAGDFGFDMTLSAQVPVLIEKNIRSFAQTLAGMDKDLQSMDWPIHPGGKTILEAAEKSLGLKQSHTSSSWKILARYGNLSSATFLHVLDDLSQQKSSFKYSVGLGFGPGLSIEGLLLRNCFAD